MLNKIDRSFFSQPKIARHQVEKGGPLTMSGFHIVHVIESFGAGAFAALLNICNHPGGFRHSIIYSTRPETPENYNELFPEETAFRFVAMSRAINPIKDARAFLRILVSLKELKPDTVHCHSAKAGGLGRIAARCLGIPSVYTPHGYSFLQTDIPSWRKMLYTMIEKTITPLGTAIAACGEQEYSLALRLCGKRQRVFLIKNSIDLDMLSTVCPAVHDKDLPRIGMSGRCALQRNPELFTALAKELSPKSRWLWIGADAEDPALPDCIHKTGWMSRESALSLVSSLDI